MKRKLCFWRIMRNIRVNSVLKMAKTIELDSTIFSNVRFWPLPEVTNIQCDK